MKKLAMKIRYLWTKLVNKLNLFTRDQMKEKMALSEELGKSMLLTRNQLDSMIKQNITTANELKAMEDKCKRLEEKLEAYRNAARENDRYVRDVQRQLAEVLEKQPENGFRAGSRIPGSMTFDTEYVRDNEDHPYVSIHGCAALDTKASQAMELTPVMKEKVNIAIDYMMANGMLERFVRSLILYSGVSFTLGYHTNDTPEDVEGDGWYEIFYNVVVHKFDDYVATRFTDDTTNKDITRVEQTRPE